MDKSNILYVRSYTKARLLRLCRKLCRREDEYVKYITKYISFIERCLCYRNLCPDADLTNIYEVGRRWIILDIGIIRVEIMKEFQKLIAPSVNDYVNVCCGKVLIDYIPFHILMFELIYLNTKRIAGGVLTCQDWYKFITEVISDELRMY